MASIIDAFSATFRNFRTDGVPATGPNEVWKAEARALGARIEQGIESIADGQVLADAKFYATKAVMDADFANQPLNRKGLVYADAIAANNGLYSRGGSIWGKVDFTLPASVIADIAELFERIAELESASGGFSAAGPSPLVDAIVVEDGGKVYVPQLHRANGVVAIAPESDDATLFNHVIQFDSDPASLATPNWLGLDYAEAPPELKIKEQPADPHGPYFGVLAKRVGTTWASPAGLPLIGPGSAHPCLKNECPAGRNDIERAQQFQDHNLGNVVDLTQQVLIDRGLTRGLSGALLPNGSRYSLYGGSVLDGRSGQWGSQGFLRSRSSPRPLGRPGSLFCIPAMGSGSPRSCSRRSSATATASPCSAGGSGRRTRRSPRASWSARSSRTDRTSSSPVCSTGSGRRRATAGWRRTIFRS